MAEKIGGGGKPEKYDAESGEYISKDEAASKTDLDEFDFEDDLLSIGDIDDDLKELKFEDIGKTKQELRQESRSMKHFEETRKKALENAKPELTAEEALILKEVMDNVMKTAIVASRIKSKDFFAFIESGVYMNQFQVGHTNGYFGADEHFGGARGEMTHKRFGTDISNSDNDITERYEWEKYRFIDFEGDEHGVIDGDDGAKYQYGDIVVCFNKDKVKDVTTLTFGDSLDNYDDEFYPAGFTDDIDEFAFHNRYRLKQCIQSGLLQKCKNIRDIKDVTYSSYVEAQIHINKLDIGEYVDQIVIPYDHLHNPSVLQGIELCHKNFPNIKFVTEGKHGGIRYITYNSDTQSVEYGDFKYKS